MSCSAFRNKRGKDLTKAMLIEKIEHMTTLLIYMEKALTEWEIWHRLLPLQKEGLSATEYEHVVKDGPIFEDDTVLKIMQSIRQGVPEFKPVSEEEKKEQDRPALFDGSGNIIEKKK
jgi:hypothetical protein